MNAHPTEQKTLLRVQELDTRLLQLAHQARTLPQDSALAALDEADAAVVRDRLDAHTALEAARTEFGRLEADVELVRARIVKDTERESVVQSAKDASALEHEIASLRERLAVLEDAEVELLERVESCEAELALIDGRAQERRDARRVLEAERGERLAELERERDVTATDRRALAATLDAALLSQYESRRERTGVGAGLLRQKTCGACAIVLTGTDLERVRATAADVLVFCPECDAILVRTEESGL